MKKNVIRKLGRGCVTLALAGAILIGGSNVRVFASDITAGTWSLYYNSPVSKKVSETVVLTARSGNYTAKCNKITDAIAVRFYGSYISASSPIFASAGSKSFTFSGGYGVNQNVTFKIMDDGANTGSASGSAYKNTY